MKKVKKGDRPTGVLLRRERGIRTHTWGLSELRKRAAAGGGKSVKYGQCFRGTGGTSYCIEGT